MNKTLNLACATLALTTAVFAQSSAPVVIQAITPAQAPVQQPVAPAPAVDTSAAIIKSLQDAKAANAEILKKQADALEQLAEIEKTAEQIRIYSKRG